MNAWDADSLALDNAHPFISSTWQWATMIDDERQVGGWVGGWVGACMRGPR